VEEQMVDHFQDLLISLEDDEQVTGYTEALAWNDGHDSIANTQRNDKETGSYQSTDLTPAGVLGWLTGQKHVPINEDNLIIHVHFDHDCITRNNLHTVCFPVNCWSMRQKCYFAG
jgi:urease accessory protein UreE